MKINRLEAHDRLNFLKKDQDVNIFQGASDCMLKNPLSLAMQEKCPYIYIFAHPRTADDGVTKRMLWQPRLSKPSAQSNSYLFRAQSKTDILEVCWLIPDRMHWEQYKKKNVTENELAIWSINQYRYNRIELEKPHPDDWPESKCKPILQQIIAEHKERLRQEKMMMKAADEPEERSDSTV